MAHVKYNPENKVVLDELLLHLPGVTAGVVFGLPCYKVNGAVFVTLYEDGVSLKMPVERVAVLLEAPGFGRFQPFGRNRGKEFIIVHRASSKDLFNDGALFLESMEYVSSL